MLLRAATPLSLLLLIAFALLLLSTISVPIIKAIPLATDEGWAFGVFGYCTTNGNNCISPHIGYKTDQLFTSGDNGDFSLPSGSRNNLSYILIIHPIAALLTLICLVLALASHFHGPASSSRFLLALLILTIPTVLASLLAFLVDILLFVPHLAWGGWIVLAATILIVMSSVLSCAMRRSLVSRKAQSKRIAENDDMNGTTYYNALNEHRLMVDQSPGRPPSPPTTSSYADKHTPQIATYEEKSHDSAFRASEEHAPLNPSMREGSVRSNSTGPGARRPYDADQPSMPYDSRMSPQRSPQDEFGNSISPVRSNELNGPMSGRGNYNGPPRGMPYGRGRGYGPPQRGFPAQRGGYGPPRGAYGPARGGYPPRGGYRGGVPPPGFNGRGGYPQQGPRRDPSPGYTLDPYYSRDSPSRLGEPDRDNQYGRGTSPGPGMAIGQAIEMDERTGSPPNMSYNQHDHVDSIAQRTASPSRQQYRHDDRPAYADDSYIPPRADWTPAQSSPSRHAQNQQYTSSRGLSPIQASPNSDTLGGARHVRNNSENYYEDVDPRFAADESAVEQSANVPHALMPGSSYTAPRMAPQPQDPNFLRAPPSRGYKSSNSNSSVENDPLDYQIPGPRSPDGSEASHFTSISQRPVNPHWRPGYSGGGEGSSAVAAQRRKEDLILHGNPDFSVPGASTRRARGGSASNIVTAGLTPGGRYPSEL